MEYEASNEAHMLNEQYFLKVFEALRHTKNPEILKKLLKVIKFYIYQDTSACQKDIIKPDTILWMLEIMEEQKHSKYLCCLTSATLLEIVSKHEIHFDYQEVAIIKKFNLALQNIEVFDQESICEKSYGHKSSSVVLSELSSQGGQSAEKLIMDSCQSSRPNERLDIDQIDEESKTMTKESKALSKIVSEDNSKSPTTNNTQMISK